MGELRRVLVERLAREFRVEARIGNPGRVSQTVTQPRRRDHSDREIADKPPGRTACAWPNERNSGFTFTSALADGAAPAAALGWIESAARAAMGSGPFAGYPLLDIAVRLEKVDLPGDAATEIAVRGATSEAFRLAAHAAGPVLLEPVVRVEVVVPGDYAGEVLRDLNARRAQVSGMESREKLERMSVTVALSRMFGYATDLRSLTRGRGSFTMEPSHYEPAEEAMARFRG
jgi:elongation factor G